MRSETKLKLLQASSLLILGGVFICLLWNVYDISNLEGRVQTLSDTTSSIATDNEKIVELELQAEASEAEVESLQNDVDALRDALEAERRTTEMLRLDLQKAVKDMREATGQ